MEKIITFRTVELDARQWVAEGERRYGPDRHAWRFKCPSCGFVQGLRCFTLLGMALAMAERYVGFSCVGRFIGSDDDPATLSQRVLAGLRQPPQEAFTGGPGPCNYAGGGLIRIAPLRVAVPGGDFVFAFDFADEPLATVPAPLTTI